MGTRTANIPPKKLHGFSMYNLSTSAKYSTPFFPKIQEKNLSISHFSPDCTWKTHVIFSGHIAASRTHIMAAYTSLHSPWLLRITCPNITKQLHVSSPSSFRGPELTCLNSKFIFELSCLIPNFGKNPPLKMGTFASKFPM